MNRKTVTTWSLWLCSTLAVFYFSIPLAYGQSAGLNHGGLDAHLFRPAYDTKGFISTNGTDILGEGDYSFGLIIDGAFGILPINGFEYNKETSLLDDPKGKRTDRLINSGFTGTLHFNYGLGNLAIVGIQVPIQVFNGPRTVVPGVYNDREHPVGLDSQGFGDITLGGKIRILRRERAPLGLAAILQVGLPAGNASRFRGEPGVSLWPILATEWKPIPQFRAGLNVGYRFNSGKGAKVPFDGRVDPAGNTADASTALLAPAMCGGITGTITNAICPQNVRGGKIVEYDDLLTFGAALGYRFVAQAELIADVYGGQIISGFGDKGALGMEALGGIKIFVEKNSYLLLGAGAGIVQSVNSADVRGVLGFVFEPSIGDRDGDGYKDDVDKCPDEPEDFDNFEDQDGCPDPDNDRDGILDVDDACPNVPEDRDGDADEDGCPEDTIGDRDGDGILDNVDKCPDEPEDLDGFQDEDGCPDPDNDQDGILDKDDMCPNDPEDKDGFQDEDGCPDPDNDHDRILDVNDACPNEPETYNGYQDEDGCPDRGNVVIEENQIIILEKIYFATDSAEILQKSFPIVDAVSATLNGNPQLELVEIQGHADERSSDKYNIELTRDRAASVRQALIQRGVDPSRLRSAGYGERCPIDPGHNEQAWEKNRRVEFKIIKTDAGPTGVEVACPAGQELIPK
jgi:OmpA-OmpF porin, OOP family